MGDPKSDTEAATARLHALLEATKPPTGGLSLDDLVSEVAPLLPLLIEIPPAKRLGGDFDAFEFRESYTVATLVGRRLALLDLTPTSAMAVLEETHRAVDPAVADDAPGFVARLMAAAIEGFVLGREERVAQTANERSAQPLRPLRIDDSVFALIISGVHEPTILGECVDALGRAMLDAGVEVAIVDLAQLGEPNRERAVSIFGAEEVARMLGGRCYFTGVDERWKAAAADAGIPLDALDVRPTFGEALRAASGRDLGDAEKPKSAWWRRLTRLVG